MLGRIFENLLAEQNPETGESARKATGSYYTPREIVDFMVEESLIAYLKTKEGNKEEAILYPLSKATQPLPDEAIEDFVHTGALPDALKPYSKELLDRLNAIRVLDPACGSGAFPISMLQKLVALKHQLAPQDSPYDLKLKSIENSIYGVDIQPMATELSRLRCWLSLIVDEDPKDIKPLPNLDFKFVTANSLIDLGYEEFIRTMQNKKSGGLLLIANFLKDLDALKALRQNYFEPSLHQKEKDKLKKDFNAIKDDLFKMSLELIKQKHLDAEFANKVIGWDPFDDSKAAPFFNKSWMFGVEDGFDVVIGNPPYIDSEMMVKTNPEFRQLLSKHFKTAKGNWDLYVIFFEMGFSTLRSKGVLSYITPNKWLSIGYGKELRKLINTDYFMLCNCSKIKVFEAGNTPVISFLRKDNDAQLLRLYEFSTDNVPISIGATEQGLLSSDNWGIFLSPHINLLLKILEVRDHLRDFVDVENPFSTSEAYQLCDLLIDSQGEASSYFRLINTGTIDPYVSLWGLKTTSYLKGKYHYPVVDKKKFNKSFPKRFEQTISSKIIVSGMRYFECFYDDQGNYIAGKSTIILRNFRDAANPTYLLSLLNSILISFYLKQSYSALGIDGGINFSADIIEQIPIPRITLDLQQPFIALVDQILTAKQNDPNADTSALEREIDELVYKLYDLTPEEVAIVVGNNANK